MAKDKQFPLSYIETEQAIERYKAEVDSGKRDKADFWTFCGICGVSDAEMMEVINSPTAENRRLSDLLKRFTTWLKGQYLSGRGWSGPNTSKAIFALKQQLGGYQFSDVQESKQNNDIKIHIDFGGSKDSFR